MKIINKISQILLILVVLFVYQIGFSQFTIPEKPDFQTSVYDYAKILTENQKSQLEEKLVRYSDSTSTQIVIVTVPTINGEDIGILTPKWGHQWGVGQAKQDNGVFVLLAQQEHKIWISPGYGVEDRLTAGIVGELTRDVIIPEFKTGNYYAGLDKGSDAIFQILKGEYKGTRKPDDSSDGMPIIFFVFLFIIIIIIISKNSSGGNRIGGSPSLLDMIILSNMGRSSGGSFGGGGFGGSSGGGGFGGGFGGGGFSGGGAGGSW